ncbi:hypothetical protein [Blastococcus sp. CT_GayMR19]|nr:hypothetical protein [Blastococcus sp. CT_GayMR19]
MPGRVGGNSAMINSALRPERDDARLPFSGNRASSVGYVLS